MPSPRPRRARRLPLDERLELLVVVRQRLGEREEPPDGVLRAAEAHLDPAGLRPSRPRAGPKGAPRAPQSGHRGPDPDEPGLADRGDDQVACAAPPRRGTAARCPGPSGAGAGARSRGKDTRRPDGSAPNVRISCAARARDTPNSRSTSRRVSRSRSRASSCRMASGTARSHLGGAGIRQASSDVTCLANAGWEDF